MTSNEFRCNLYSTVTFNPNFENGVIVDSGYWHCPGHVVARSQTRPRPGPVAPFWRLYSLMHRLVRCFTLGGLSSGTIAPREDTGQEKPPGMRYGTDLACTLPPAWPPGWNWNRGIWPVQFGYQDPMDSQWMAWGCHVSTPVCCA